MLKQLVEPNKDFYKQSRTSKMLEVRTFEFSCPCNVHSIMLPNYSGPKHLLHIVIYKNQEEIHSCSDFVTKCSDHVSELH